MKKETTVIILGTAHLGTTPGKCSPDGKFREAVYSREIVRAVEKELTAKGFNVLIDYLPLEPPATVKSSSAKTEQNRELYMRSGYVNGVCVRFGAANCLYVSIHVNAAGADGQWHGARGWSVYTSPGRTKGDHLADCLWRCADVLFPKDHKNAMRADWSDGDPDYEAKFHVLTQTKCAAALTENFFQDNKEDVAYMLSDEGRQAIVDVHVQGIINYIYENP